MRSYYVREQSKATLARNTQKSKWVFGHPKPALFHFTRMDGGRGTKQGSILGIKEY